MSHEKKDQLNDDIDPFADLVKGINCEIEYHVQEEILQEAIENETLSK